MKLVLCIKDHFLAELEVAPVQWDCSLSFKERTTMNEYYLQQLIKGFKLKHQKAIEYKRYEIFLVAESKVNLINQVE